MWQGRRHIDTAESATANGIVFHAMRRPRQIRAGAHYHVVARINRSEFILGSPQIKNIFLETLRNAKKRYNFDITNFCIMGNHIHLMIAPKPGQSLSRIMQWVLSVFAVRFNRVYGYHGHVWYDRFKSKIIDNLQQFIKTFSYIVSNPVRASIVRQPGEYKYGGVFYFRKGDFTLIEPPCMVLRLIFPEYSVPHLLC